MKEGKRLRVLRVGFSEEATIPVWDDYYATCGSRLVRMGNSAMDEGLPSVCTLHVLKRLRGGAHMGGTGSEYYRWAMAAFGMRCR